MTPSGWFRNRSSFPPIAARFALAVILSFGIAGCGKGDPDRGKLDALATAPLTPGVGWGPLALDETRLGAFVETYGAGHPLVVNGMISGIELNYRQGQVAFLFLADGASEGLLKREGARLGPMLAKSPKTFFTRFPALSGLRLHSIAVATGKTPEETFYKGSTSTGVSLFQKFSRAPGRYAIPRDVVAQLVAGGPAPVTASVRADLGVWVYSNQEPANRDELMRMNMAWPMDVHRIIIMRVPKIAEPTTTEVGGPEGRS